MAHGHVLHVQHNQRLLHLLKRGGGDIEIINLREQFIHLVTLDAAVRSTFLFGFFSRAHFFDRVFFL